MIRTMYLSPGPNPSFSMLRTEMTGEPGDETIDMCMEEVYLALSMLDKLYAAKT